MKSAAPDPAPDPASNLQPPPRPNQARDLACCALSAFLVLAAVLATNPILDMGTNDDWSYAFGALKFAQTGKLVYCGWSRPFLGLQAVWGAGAIHLFGFSFTVLRLSLLPFAMGSAALVFLLARRVGLKAGPALFGTLTFSLSPLYVPLAASFMTEVPNLFFILLALLACIAALQSASDRDCVAWIAIAALAGIDGGTIRQTGFMVPLTLLPVLMLCTRRIRSKPVLLLTTAAFWTITLAAYLGLSHWQALQPYSEKQNVLADALFAFTHPAYPLGEIASIISCSVFLVLPAALVFLACFLPTLGKGKIAVALVLAVVFFFALRHNANPFVGNIVTPSGIMGDDHLEALGVKPVILPKALQAVTEGLLYLTFACALLVALPKIKPLFSGFLSRLKSTPWEDRPAAAILVPFAAAYILTLAFLAEDVFDRYILPLLAVAFIALLRSCQARLSPKILAAGYASLLVFAFYSVASTHDYLASERARAAAAAQIQAFTGLPRTAISAGLEYDAWTELMISGHVNNPNAFQNPTLPFRPESRIYWFLSYVPHVQPTYFVVYSEQTSLAATAFPPFTYTAWLPPFHREFLIQTLPPARDK